MGYPGSIKASSLVAATRPGLTLFAKQSHLSRGRTDGHGVCSLTGPNSPGFIAGEGGGESFNLHPGGRSRLGGWIS